MVSDKFRLGSKSLTSSAFHLDRNHKFDPVKDGKIFDRMRKNSDSPSLPPSWSQRKSGAGVHPAEGGTASAGMTT